MSETLINTNQNQLNNDDASFVELIQQTQEGKANLTQAIIDKGGNVSNSSTYDQLAQAINGLDTADGNGKYLVQKWSDEYSISEGYPATLICARVLPHHNAMLGITTDGLLGIYKLSDEGRVVLEISANTGFTPFIGDTYSDYPMWHIFGFNKSETKAVWCDLKNKNMAAADIDWENNTINITFTYTIESDMGIGKREEVMGYNTDTRGLAISENGEYIVLLTSTSTLYANIIIPNYNDGTATEKIGFNTAGGIYIGYGVYNTGFSQSMYYYDSVSGVIEGLDAVCGIFTINLDISGEYPILSGLTYTHPRETGYGIHSADSGGSYSSFPLVFKNALNKDFYVQAYAIDDDNAVLFLNKYTETKTYDVIKLRLLPNKIKGSEYKTRFNISYYNINYYILNNEIHLVIGPWFIVKIDESGLTPKFVVINNNRTKAYDAYLCCTIWFTNTYLGRLSNGFFNAVGNKYVITYENGHGGYFSNYHECIKYLNLKDVCVLAEKFTDSKNNEIVAQIALDQSIYDAGGYRLVNEANTLTEDE